MLTNICLADYSRKTDKIKIQYLKSADMLTKAIKRKAYQQQFTLLMLTLLVVLITNIASAANIDSLRFWTSPDRTRLVFGISTPLEYKVFTLDNPPRIVMDVKNAKFSAKIPTIAKDHKLVSRIRQGVRNKKDLRLVLDLKESIKPKTFLLKPNASYGHRLVLDVYPEKRKIGAASAVVTKTAHSQLNKKWIVAIDAGHGGEDPGAKGHRGTREKDVVLKIAKKLASLVNKQPGMKAVLIRSGDYYIGLRKRMQKARAARADFFVSIHADAFKDQRAHGSSVYVLSNRGASSEVARWLANSENAADLVGGVSLGGKDDVLASVLLDLSVNATKDASTDVAARVLKNLRGLGHVHKKTVQRAGFMVLKSPDIPSILVETAFISNRKEESKLRSSAHQTKIAKAIFKGLKSYYISQSLPSSYIASNRYKIRSGDTLSAIAVRHQVSIKALKRANSIKTDRIRIGQVLKIPS